jgi:hypothetical protein
MKENRFLIVFAKEPRCGQVKTRLSDCLSRKQAVGLYKAFIQDTIEISSKCKNCTRILAYHAEGNPLYLKKVANGYTFYKQQKTSLGQRLYNAFVFARNQGSTKTVIIGSDAPDLPISYIETAFSKLSRHDLIFGPSKDGGYYLVGLKMPVRNIFQGIKWSTSSVLQESLLKAKKANKSVYLLKPWQDVDCCEDLNRLEENLKNKTDIAQHTRRWLYGKQLE